MTSRERVRAVLERRIPDRVPIDIGANMATGYNINGYIRLAEYLGLDSELPATIYEPFFMLARMGEKIRKRLHCDVVQLENISYEGMDNRVLKPWINEQGYTALISEDFDPVEEDGYIFIIDKKTGAKLARMPRGGHYFDYYEEPGAGDIELIDTEALKKTVPVYTDEHLRLIEAEGKRLYEDTDYAICGAFGGGGLTMLTAANGYTLTDWLCLLLMEPEYCYEALKTIALVKRENLKMYLQACGKYLDIITMSYTDFGTQNNELFSPDIFKEIYVPNYRIMTDCVHENSRAKVFFHSCGSVYNLYGHFIDAGVDIINPVQISAKNMEPEKIKKNFGDRIILWGGGVDTQHVLPFGTPEEVAQAARASLEVFKPGGGYVFNQVHCIQGEVPPENVLAMADAAYEFGAY